VSSDDSTGRVHTNSNADSGDLSWREDMTATQRAIANWGDVEWLVVDHYDLDANWERPMRGLVRRSMVIDDLANRPHDCDLVLDHNCGAEEGHRYDGLVNDVCQRLLGPEYALLAPAFTSRAPRRDRNGVVARIVVSFGGADPRDETTKAIRALLAIDRPDLEVAVAVGASNVHWEKIAALCSTRPNIRCARAPGNMAEVFDAADLAIGGGGVSLLERCARSLPAITESLAANQEPGCRALARRGGALYLGDAGRTTVGQIALAVQTMLGSPELVHHMSEQSGAVVDGCGVNRVIRAMLATPIVVRVAEAADCDTVWEWRNHSLTRKFAKDPSEIALDAHREWFAAVLGDIDRRLLVGEDDRGKIGIVRYDVTGDTATISVFVDPHRHGQGIGSRLIGAADAWILARHPAIRKVIAEIHSENKASVRAFARAGYVERWRHLVREFGGVEH
jgi:UDP-2,4-diacetamido-2,4,6-trideoxy-beta-L-altropyranose hydrolase